jgi:adenylosuccinate synthase
MHKMFSPKNKRPNSIAICGGAFGDEGKGRITDEFTALFLETHKQVVQYRDNGGANAGHTVEVGSTKISLHQVGSAILQPGAIVISGKGMVIHPEDLVSELEIVKKVSLGKIPATYIIDEMAVLSLDTHRAMENCIKARTTGSRGATGRGISSAYADIINRYPIRARDIFGANWLELVKNHYHLYADMLRGLGFNLAQTEVSHLNETVVVGDVDTFIKRLNHASNFLKPHIQSVYTLIQTLWSSNTPFVFEKAQAIGLDARFGVYPDVTASDCTFAGILASTEGLIHPQDISVKAAVIKATYTSSVGARVLPSSNHHLTTKIREDAHEYGATTGRPRDIHYLDIPLLSFLMQVGGVEYLCPTHLDIAYPEEPIKVVVAYTRDGQTVPYRPDQEYLLGVKPVFKEFPSWDSLATKEAKAPSDLPLSCQDFLSYLSTTLNVKLLLGTTGPIRHQTIKWF